MIEFLALASSSAGCSYRVGCGRHAPLLIDAGLSFGMIQRGLAFEVSSLAGVLISHAHGDHSKAIPALMRHGVDVYASAETWEILKLSGHRAKTIEPRVEFDLGPWRIHPFGAVHDMPGTLGFVIASPEADKLLYLTDSAYSKFKFEGLTHLAIEANFSKELIKSNTLSGAIDPNRFKRTSLNHMSIERLIDMLKANDLSLVEEIYLIHLSDQNSNAEDFRQQVQRATGKPTYICEKLAVSA